MEQRRMAYERQRLEKSASLESPMMELLME
jgi:hypothetical protein